VPAADVRIVAELGRAMLVWCAAFVVCADTHEITRGGLVAITFATLVWLLALRSTAVTAHPVLGGTLAAGVGTMLGFVVVAVTNASFVGLRASVTTLIALSLGIFCSVSVWDWVVERTLAGRRRVLLVGANELGAISDELSTSQGSRFDVIGAVPDGHELAQVVEARRPDIVVLTDEAAFDAAVDSIVEARANVRLTSVAGFFEFAFGRIPVEQITPAWFMCLVHPRQQIYSRLTKRVFDLVLASLGLALAAPILALLAVLTKLDGGPVFYRQARIGEGGRRFTIYKIRTMVCDAERNGARFSADDDPRATPVGAILRRTHLDELPQLWNVLRGEMSIVGPRPERPEFIRQLESAVPFWSRRLLVKPGITGWAQVRCRYAADCEGMQRKLSYDLWYLRHRSVLVDFAVCLATLRALVRRAVDA
jgi:exopolysaccharide biosynthesis polyprenyl glycosylphosphotransferase